MANYNNLKNATQEVIKTNGNKEITGQVMQDCLIALINSLGAGYQFVGKALPITNPGTPDYNVVYVAEPGEYTNFGGLVVPDGHIGFLCYNGAWVLLTVQTSPFSVTSIADGIVQLMEGDTPTYPRSKAEAIFFDNDTSKTLPQIAKYIGPAYRCFEAIGTDHEDKTVTFGTSSILASKILNAFLTLELSGFDTTLNYVISLFRYHYTENNSSEIIISSLSNGIRTEVAVFNVTSNINNLGGVNHISVLSTDATKKMVATIDYSNVPDGVSTRMSESNNFIIASHCLKGEPIFESDLTIERISNNLANPANIVDGRLITSNGVIANNASWALISIPVTPGQTITFGGFYLGRTGYYAFYNGNTLVSTNIYDDPDGGVAATIVVPAGANFLYFDIKSGNSPASPYTYVQANLGDSLLTYDEYKEAITKIKNTELAGSGGGDISQLETRVEALESGVAGVLLDLPVSDGSGISTGYAYIDSVNGNVKIKL